MATAAMCPPAIVTTRGASARPRSTATACSSRRNSPRRITGIHRRLSSHSSAMLARATFPAAALVMLLMSAVASFSSAGRNLLASAFSPPMRLSTFISAGARRSVTYPDTSALLVSAPPRRSSGGRGGRGGRGAGRGRDGGGRSSGRRSGGGGRGRGGRGGGGRGGGGRRVQQKRSRRFEDDYGYDDGYGGSFDEGRSGWDDDGRRVRRGREQRRLRDDDYYGYDDYDSGPPSTSRNFGYDDGGSSSSSSTLSVIPPRINSERLRSSINCEHFGKCPGCVADSSIGNVPTIQSAFRYFEGSAVRNNLVRPPRNERDGVFEVVIPSELTGWRTQAKLAVSSKSGRWGRDGCIFGLYERGTHYVLPIPNCAVHHPSVNKAAEALTRATAKVGTAPYDEDMGEGGLRYVQAQVERATGKVCLTLVWNAEDIKGTQPGLSRLVKALKKEEPKLWHSIWCHLNPNFGNAIFARGAGRWHRLDGPEFIREPLPGSSSEGDEGGEGDRPSGLLYFTPSAFRQGNHDGFDNIALHVARAIPPGSKVCELYAGVGVLGLTALSHHAREAETYKSDVDWYGQDEADSRGGEEPKPLRWLRCSDENPNNPRCFDRAVASMPEEVTGRAPRGGKRGKAKRRGSSRGGDDPGGAGADDGGGEEMSIADLMKQIELEAEGGGGGAFAFGDDGEDDDDAGVSVTYTVASASEALRSGEALGADVIVVDPPRRGLCPDVLAELCKERRPAQPRADDAGSLLSDPAQAPHAVNWVNDATTLVYVSCGFDALARDCDRLLTSGGSGWKLESATGYVLFPGSDHVETVAVFKRDALDREGGGGGGKRRGRGGYDEWF